MKDWTGNQNSVYTSIGARNYAKEEREEINEFLAEKLFDLKVTTAEERYYLIEEYCKSTPDYCSNAMPVLEKLAIDVKSMTFAKQEAGETDYYAFIIETYDGYEFYENGDTINESICRCAVEYLKNMEGKYERNNF